MLSSPCCVILFCQVCHCSTLSNKPSGGGRRFPSSTLVAEKSFPCPGPPSPVGVCVHKNRGSRDLWLAEPTCPHSGAAPFPLFQQLQFPEQGWLPWKHHLHTSPKSLQQPKLPLLNPAPNTSLDRGTSPAQDSDSQCSLEEFLDKAQLPEELTQDPPPMLLTPDSAERSVPAPAPQWPLKPWDFLSLVDPARPELSVAAGKNTSKSQEVLHRGCHNSLSLQLLAGESWLYLQVCFLQTQG